LSAFSRKGLKIRRKRGRGNRRTAASVVVQYSQSIPFIGFYRIAPLGPKENVESLLLKLGRHKVNFDRQSGRPAVGGTWQNGELFLPFLMKKTLFISIEQRS
jgi:hypothetical protein